MSELTLYTTSTRAPKEFDKSETKEKTAALIEYCRAWMPVAKTA
jgi:hypothetical protein